MRGDNPTTDMVWAKTYMESAAGIIYIYLYKIDSSPRGSFTNLSQQIERDLAGFRAQPAGREDTTRKSGDAFTIYSPQMDKRARGHGLLYGRKNELAGQGRSRWNKELEGQGRSRWKQCRNKRHMQRALPQYL